MGRGSSKASGGSLKNATNQQIDRMNTMKSLVGSVGDTVKFAMQSDGTIAYIYTNPTLGTRNMGIIYKDGQAVLKQSQPIRG